MIFQGKAWKFGDNIDTDIIIPARFLNVSEKEKIAKNCFADLRPNFVETINHGDIIVAGRNFGCGSSREHAPLAIKSAGISLVIAESFARIFYRNAFNIGLPILESKDASRSIKEGDHLSVNLSTGEIEDNNTGKRFRARAIPDFMRNLVQAGGLVEYVKEHHLKELRKE
jgi:3-isopropylmalate/(R)-2-methylmalate dehydratase small subunit